MDEIIPVVRELPALPLRFPHPLEGVGLDHRALVMESGIRSAAQAIAEFRARHAPESLPHFRRFYLKPHQRNGQSTGRWSIRYVWNMSDPTTDRTVGTMIGEDLARARVVIGNASADCWMTSISWVLCEDRDGEEPILMGRYDPWSLLQEVTPEDLERLAQVDVVPQMNRWDFDLMWFGRQCPRCGNQVSILMMAFDIDSARCANCGVHPHLSQAIVRQMRDGLADITGTRTSRDAVRELSHYVSWMGHVGAGVENLDREDLPGGVTPHAVLQNLLTRTELTASALGQLVLHPRVIQQLIQSGQGHAVGSVHSAAVALSQAVQSGRPFTRLEAAMAELVREAASAS